MIVAITDKNGLFGRFEKLPTAEAERWHAAFVETDGRRHVKSKQAGLNGVCWMTLNEFCDEVEGRIFRWLHGRYEVCEAAQILADANPGTVVIPGPDAEEMCKLMEAAIHAGDLTVRLNGVELPAASFTQYRLYKHTVFESDVKNWLKKNPCGYTFNYPYHTPNSDLQASPVVAERVATASDGPAQLTTALAWSLKTSLERTPGYRWPLIQFLRETHVAGKPCPKAQEVLDDWKLSPPSGLKVIKSGRCDALEYELMHGGKKTADLKAIQAAINDLVIRIDQTASK